MFHKPDRGRKERSPFLAAQLDSIVAQTHSNWHVFASDDHSTDGTLAVLNDYRRRWGDDRLAIRSGPGQGFCANFLSLAGDPAIQAAYYAFADHDDIWDEDKLAVALAWLTGIPRPPACAASGIPACITIRGWATSGWWWRH